MHKKYLQEFICCLSLLFFTACSAVAGKPYLISPATVTPTQLPLNFATLQAYPTPLTILDVRDQVSDGKLLFSVEEVEPECHKAGAAIRYKMTFKNLSAGVLTLLNYFHIAVNRASAGGNITLLLSTSDNRDVLTTADFGKLDFFSFEQPLFFKLAAGDSYRIVLEKKFPSEIVLGDARTKLNTAPPTPGQYFVRFLYVNAEDSDNAWTGVIASNKIGICIVQ